ncbi:MAG TPA: DUF2141 domain-containing protein [Leucothrix sp.]|nr:DUF2141 domain-containing protein [Leucothrix sp.]
MNMKKVIKHGLIVLLALTTNQAIFADKLTINISGAIVNQGKVLIAVFNNAKAFPSGTPVKRITLAATAESHSIDLPKGVYAIAAFQDKNNNNKLDFNFFKIPKEKMGVSGKKQFGKPNFLNASFKLSNKQSISINMK